MRIAVAQIKPEAGNIEKNREKHLEAIDLAADRRVRLLIFPELSLTGYEPTLAAKMVQLINDETLKPFQEASDRYHMTIGVGLPSASENGNRISMYYFQPGQEPVRYSKRYLHEDEEPYFIPGDKQEVIHIDEDGFLPAICYESLLDVHACQAVELDASVYLASVAKPQRGLDKAMEIYPDFASTYNMMILMANSVGPADNFESVGQSAIWDQDGDVVDQLDAESEALLIYDHDQGWSYVAEL